MHPTNNLLLGALAAPALAIALAACSIEIEAGDAETRLYDVEDFDQVEISGGFDADIRVGEATMVEIEAGENVHDNIEVKVDDRVLIIELENVTILGRSPLNATIHTPTLEGLDISGATDVEVDGLDADSFSIDVSGASNIEGDGRIGELRLDASGASSTDLDSVTIDDATIDISGASSVELTSASRVTGDASGASSVDVDDDADVDVETSGASSID